ncbi:hypothetical protein HDV05_003109 [Chytridiales sp. JEL 0842]|nr:hypothetical protein HDV05_003109 [Chytridiales sp. JEL 0842]
MGDGMAIEDERHQEGEEIVVRGDVEHHDAAQQLRKERLEDTIPHHEEGEVTAHIEVREQMNSRSSESTTTTAPISESTNDRRGTPLQQPPTSTTTVVHGIVMQTPIDAPIKDVQQLEQQQQLQQEFNSSSPIIYTITDKNYTLLHTDTWLINTYAPWCPHSLALVNIYPEIISTLYQNTSLKFSTHPSTYKFALVNAHTNSKTAALLEVRSYPSVKLIQAGNVWTMRGNLTKEGVVSFVGEGWRAEKWYNKLPPTWSIWFV